MKNEQNKALTLSEILITLGIIGIIAALTIPNLINNYKKTQTETQLKKTYSILTQFFKQYMADEGCEDLMCTGLFDPALTTDEYQAKAENIIKQYIKTVKTCKGSDTSCSVNTKFIKGPNTGTAFTGTPSIVFVSTDGIKFQLNNASCAQTAYPDMSKLKNICSWLLVDLNSDKPPNTYGKDIFHLGNVSQNGDLYPDTSVEWAKAKVGSTWETYSSYWRNTTGGAQCGEPGKTIAESSSSIIPGQNCLSRIIENGWKIDYY